jgi:hypothetical protein
MGKPINEDVLDALLEDKSFEKTMREFIAGRFDSLDHKFKYELDMVLENVIERVRSKDEEGLE